MKNKDHYHFPENLRTILGQYENLSCAAEEFGISRQQVNKYLRGTRMPSFGTLKNIADTAKVRPDDLLLPPVDFLRVWSPPLRLLGAPTRVGRVARALLESSPRTKEILGDYCGSYHVFARMNSNPRKIGCAYSSIFQNRGLTLIKTVAYISPHHGPPEARVPTKLEGIVQWLGERAYIIDAQDVGKPSARMHYFILHPPTLPCELYLSGIMLTTNQSNMRLAYSTPVVFKKLDASHSVRAFLKACGIFEENDPHIDPNVRRLL